MRTLGTKGLGTLGTTTHVIPRGYNNGEVTPEGISSSNGKSGLETQNPKNNVLEQVFGAILPREDSDSEGTQPSLTQLLQHIVFRVLE